MSQFGLQITWNAIPSLGLPAFAHELEESDVRRTLKVYAVPVAVSETRYFVSETPPHEVEEAPASLVRETELLAHFIVYSDGETELIKVRPEVRAA